MNKQKKAQPLECMDGWMPLINQYRINEMQFKSFSLLITITMFKRALTLGFTVLSCPIAEADASVFIFIPNTRTAIITRSTVTFV